MAYVEVAQASSQGCASSGKWLNQVQRWKPPPSMMPEPSAVVLCEHVPACVSMQSFFGLHSILTCALRIGPQSMHELLLEKVYLAGWRLKHVFFRNDTCSVQSQPCCFRLFTLRFSSALYCPWSGLMCLCWNHSRLVTSSFWHHVWLFLCSQV